MNASFLRFLVPAVLLGIASFPASAQGMPPEARANIHALFDGHEKIRRTVEMTPTGYTAVTESDDATLAATLRSHVEQMSTRLQKGQPVRMHDPAFAELYRHHDEIDVVATATDKGIRVVVTGTTPAGIKIAQNHARIVSGFAARGWDAHHEDHPAALTDDGGEDTQKPSTAPGCCQGGKCCKDKAPAAKGSKKADHH